MAWTDHTWVTGETITASLLNGLRDDFRFLHDQGGDIASGTTIAPTGMFHKVTGSTQINFITPAQHTRIWLWFTGTPILGHNVSGANKIMLVAGLSQAMVANQVISLVYDAVGQAWYQAGSAPGGMTQLADVTLAIDTASFDFQNVNPGGHLELYLAGRTTETATTSSGILRFNSDAGANYDYARASAHGTSMSVTSNMAQNSMRIGDFPGANAAGLRLGIGVVKVGHYAQAVNYKPVVVENGQHEDTSSTSVWWEAQGGGWRGTAAITRVTASSASGSWLAGSRGSLYARSGP